MLRTICQLMKCHKRWRNPSAVRAGKDGGTIVRKQIKIILVAGARPNFMTPLEITS
jgi:hypothetical protein